jgi:pyruvate dehydrogenase E1 component alpha subunit
MLFDKKKFDPEKDEVYQHLNEHGELVGTGPAPLSDEETLEAFKKMVFARTADEMTVSYQRQGRMYTYPPNLGQEAVAIAAGMVIDYDDWLVPAFRELATYYAKGVRLRDLFMFWRGHEDSLLFPEAHRVMPISVPIASQLPHAAGIGRAVRVKEEDVAVFTFVGEGGTSEGDFHEGVNFAAVWECPVVFTIQNNQFAISVPAHLQSRSINFAIKAKAYGIPGIKVDGNDLFAMVDVYKEAKDYVKKHGPVLIEALTFRKGAHTTSDDPTKYRTKEEEQSWEPKDPLERIRIYLKKKKLISDKDEELWIKEYKKEIDAEFISAESYPDPSLDDSFKFMYESMPPNLYDQKRRKEEFLAWKERQ